MVGRAVQQGAPLRLRVAVALPEQPIAALVLALEARVMRATQPKQGKAAAAEGPASQVTGQQAALGAFRVVGVEAAALALPSVARAEMAAMGVLWLCLGNGEKNATVGAY
tara:strand:- start:1104 stop:1433 length:330 start_codon:yes stop_codon:yes gene_type:complete